MHRTDCGKVFLMQNLEEIFFTDDTQSERMRDTNARNFVKIQKHEFYKFFLLEQRVKYVLMMV